jgi:trans-aconitate methyltransferase|tara:strand:- start:74 stop:721 length:648 start_codon:yes stop_codon:yes gene_type:complete
MNTTDYFDFTKIPDFDSHIEMSIHDYPFLIEQAKYYGDCFAQDNTCVIDYGCSTGKMLEEIPKKENTKYIGIDRASLLVAGERKGAEFIASDFFKYEPSQKASVIFSIFFLQFLPRNKRAEALKKINKELESGGCFIVAEKTHYSDSRLENITNTAFMQSKLNNFHAEEVLVKANRLAKCMYLSTDSELSEELAVIGKPFVFWKCYGFTATLVIK